MNHLLRAGTRTAVLAAFIVGASCAQGAALFVPGDQPFGDVPPLALTGFNLSTGTQKAIQVYFNGYSWAGDVSAYPMGVDGRTQVENKLWSAFDVFRNSQACGNATDPAGSDVAYWNTGRLVVTRDGATNIPFRWGSPGLSAAQKSSIDTDVANGGKGDKIHQFLRGDRANELYQQVVEGDGVTVQSECGSAGGIFRARVGILGDVLHSRPLFVGAPPADFTFDSYPAYKAANASRPQRVYTGGNDGMVHAFDVASGRETWAYIPSMLIGSLNRLSIDPYVHTYYVDGQMTAGDVNFGTSGSPDWRTIIVGGLGAGGKGLFALDVTNASVSDETEAKAKILWEITPASSGYGSLGYTYGTPVIARMNTGDWVAIVGNGYQNTSTGHAVLYIIDIKTGTLLKALDTGSGSVASPNGLSGPTPIDTNFDGKVDRIYAGDIDGNLWKFDVSGATAASWTAPASAFFPTATDLSNGIVRQAILGAPDVAAHPITGFLVYFSTGRLLTAADAADGTVLNYAYGVWDGAVGTTFLNQTLTEKPFGTQRVRVSSGLPINWNNATDPVGNPMRKGWRTALPAGERVIGGGFVRDARFQFTGVNPTITMTPPPNGENWLIELDYLTGGATDKPVYDLNADGLLSDADRVVYALGDTIPVGKAVGDPVPGTVGIPVAVYMGSGLLSQPVLANVSAQLSTTLFNDNPYVGAGEVPAVPTPPSTEPGVIGGHFDVDIYYPAPGLCTYAGAAVAGAKAVILPDFTYAGNKTANLLVITVGGANMLSANNPGSLSKAGLRDWIVGKIDPTFAAIWNVTASGTTALKIEAKVVGTALNGQQYVVSTGGGMTVADYTLENTNTAGGADAAPGSGAIASCKSKQHFHEYDDKFNVTGVNFLNASSTTLNIVNAIPSTSTNFKVLIHNQYLSPAVTISIGGAPYIDVANYTTDATLDLGTLPIYNRGNIGTFAVNMPPDALSVKNWSGASPADLRPGLHPTQTGCVKDSNGSPAGGHQNYEAVTPPANGTNGPGVPSVNGARHNGALVIQVIKDTTPNSAIELNVAGRPEYGWRVKGGDLATSPYETYVLAEWTVFWHFNFKGADQVPPTADPAGKGKCYDDAGWTKSTVLDTGPANAGTSPAAGSADPRTGTPRATVTSSTSTTSTSGGTTTTVRTVVYSTGASMVFTTVTIAGVSTTTSQFIPAPAGSPGSPPPGGTSVGQAVSSPNTVTGYQQTRNSGKLGRVTWHEMFRQ